MKISCGGEIREFEKGTSWKEIASEFSAAYDQDIMLVHDLTENRLLELYHGPTSAFKDVALCMLPQLMSIALRGRDERLMIVTATSGDTGKAALEGFRDAEHIGITVFYPDHKVSDIQYLQMATQEGSRGQAYIFVRYSRQACGEEHMAFERQFHKHRQAHTSDSLLCGCLAPALHERRDRARRRSGFLCTYG